MQSWIRSIQFDDRGLVPTIVQDASTNAVLMLAYSNTASLTLALTEGAGWYWSRSRGMLWEKGATSGNRQRLVRADFDCDRDTLLFQVEQTGPACHRGTPRCFGVDERAVLPRLSEVIEQRKSVEATESYSKKLLDDPALVAAKLREETEEVIEATEKNHIAWECADLLYHLMVRASAAGVRWERVESELRSRF